MAGSATASSEVALFSIPGELFLAIACFGGLCAYLWGRVGRRRREPIDAAARLAETGQFRAAAELLAGPACAGGVTSVYAQAALANLHLRAGRLGQAVWMLTPLAVEGSGMSKTRRGSIEHGLAYAFALGGALDTAERHLSVTARLRDPLSPLGCLLLCKRREFGTLVELSTRQPLAPRATRSIDSAFEWHRERVVALLSAFAHAAEPGLVADSQERIEEFLDAARPTYAGEFDYLLAGWTELQSFVEAHAARLRVRSSGNVNSSPPRASVVRAGTASW